MSYKSEKITINELLKTTSPAKLYSELKINHNTIYSKIEKLKTVGGFTEKLYMFLHSFKEVPKCKQCSEKSVKFIAWKRGYREFCSVSCQSTYTHTQIPKSVQDYNKKHNTKFTNVSQLPNVIKKRNKTMMDKFGTTMPMNNHNGTVKKKEATSMKRYGVKNAAHADSVRKKAQQTMRDKTIDEKKAIQDKMQETCIERFGVSNPMKDKEIFDKAKETRLEKYGVEHCLQNPELAKEVHIKSRETLMRKYGVTCQMHVPGAMEKATKSMLRTKKYIWESGEISLVQGYEPIVLKELEDSGYVFGDIITSPEQMPIINYYLDGFEHRYYPDIFIPKDNIIIEVKSEWTLNMDLEKNEAKFEATKSLGFDFRLEVR